MARLSEAYWVRHRERIDARRAVRARRDVAAAAALDRQRREVAAERAWAAAAIADWKLGRERRKRGEP